MGNQESLAKLQASIPFVYQNNAMPDKELVTIVTKYFKYTGMHLIKGVKDLYSENHKTVKRK